MTSNAFWKEGEVQVGRALSEPQFPETPWEQSVIVPPPVLEVRLRLGFIRPDNHGRWQLEVSDPRSRELLAMHSKPHYWLGEIDDEMQYLGTLLRRLVDSYVNPDPF